MLRLDEVRRLDEIPVLGMDKTDYRGLREMIVPIETGGIHGHAERGSAPAGR